MITTITIDGKETNYTISENGEIVNKKTNKILKGTIRNNYLMVKLTTQDCKKDYLVHRLVALHFLENPFNLPQVNHKDKNRLNNNVNNLEWVTNQQNQVHRSALLKVNKRAKKQIIDINLQDWKQYLNTNYWISKTGQCYNKKTHCLLKPTISGKYLRYTLSIQGKPISILAHILVYKTFHLDYNPKSQINHIDGNSYNNNIENLEQITQKENMFHSFYILNKNVIAVNQYDLNGNFIASFPSISAAARSVNGSSSAISKVCRGKAKTHKNFIWKKQ